MTKGKGGNSGGPWGNAPGSPPPSSDDNIEDLIRKSQERFRGAFPGKGGSNGKGVMLVVLILAVLWLASGVYRVEPEEAGVVMRFGKYHETTMPGLRYHLPYPIERVYKPQVTRVQRIEIGYRSYGSRSGGSNERPVPEESLMLTGDENIIDITFNVQWKIEDAKAFLFNIRRPDDTVKDVAESVMREVIGNRNLATALTEGKQAIEDANKALLQKTLDAYGAGIRIDRVTLLKADP
ncbi:MAG: protease modulator HflK, partial [Rickettsiales bacterium]